MTCEYDAIIIAEGPEGVSAYLAGEPGSDAYTAGRIAVRLVNALAAAGHLPDLTPSREGVAVEAALAALAGPRLA